MLIKIGDSVVSTDDLVYAFIKSDSVIECHFRERGSLLVKSERPEEDLAKLEQATVQG